MTILNILPIAEGTLALGEKGSLKHIDKLSLSCKIVPNTNSTEDRPTLAPNTYIAGSETTTYELQGKIVSDLSVAGESIVEYLLNNAGKTTDFTVNFYNGETVDKYVTGKCKLRPVELGGDVGEKPEVEFTFPIIGNIKIVDKQSLNGLLDG